MTLVGPPTGRRFAIAYRRLPAQEPEHEPQDSQSSSHRLPSTFLERPEWLEYSRRDPTRDAGL